MDLQVIPDSWAATNLGSIVDYGKTQKCELADIDDVTWVVELEDIEKDTSRIISRGYTPARDFKSSKNIFSKGDILYGKLRPYLNKVVMADENGVCSTEIIPINAEPLAINKYIFYWIKSHHFLDYVNDVSYGVNMPRLGTSDGLNAPFILAPFAEQKEIVDRLDILLAQVEATQSRLARIPDIIKHFRQSVLSAASCGFTNGDVSYKKLNVLVDMLNGARRPVSASKRNDIKGNIPYYGATGVVDYLDNYTHEGRFLLVGEDGANLLSKNKDLAFIIDGKSWVNNHAHVLKAKVDVSLDFIKIVINSLDLSPWVTGSAQPKLTKRALIELPVPFFSYKEQTEIVRRVEQLFAYADTLEQQAKAAKARVDKLTQAMLAKAFRGELTADWRAANPDLISGDHSAAALLARIQAERATAKPRKRATKKSAT